MWRLDLCVVAILAWALFAWASACEVRADDGEMLDLRLQLTWRSDPPRVWAGEVSVSSDLELTAEKGRISEAGNLTPGMLLTGGIYITPDNETVRFAPPPIIGQLRDRDGKFVSPATAKGGISFRVRGRLAERVLISLRRDGSSELQTPVAISLKELAGGEVVTSQFSAAASWSLRRVDGDRLRVSLSPEQGPGVSPLPSEAHRTQSIYWDDQRATISIASDAPEDIDASAYELACDTYANGTPVLASQSWPLDRDPSSNRLRVVDAHWQPPQGDGSYEIRWRLQRKAANRSVMGVAVPLQLSDSLSYPMTLIRGGNDDRVLAESSSHVIVLSRAPMFVRFAGSSVTTQSLGRLEPFGRTWSVSRLVPFRQVTQFTSSATHAPVPKRITIDGRVFAELAPGEYWGHALPSSKIGTRHRVVVHVPKGKSMHLGICIIDRLTPGDEPVVIRDVTTIRTRSLSPESGTVPVALDFYPLTSAPQLVIVNRDANQKLAFEAVDVAAVELTPVDSKASESKSATVAAAGARRKAFMHFGIDQWLRTMGDVRATGSEKTDAQYDAFTAAMRLVETTHREGYDGVVLTVHEDGSGLYPTQSMTMSPSPVHGGPRGEDGSPETLEFLLRLFDREGLVLVPCIRPNAPMTKLERLSAAGTISRGIALTSTLNSQAVNLALNDFESGCTGIYNPSHEQVLEQAIECVSELARQCEGHDCVSKIGVIADDGSMLGWPAACEMLDSSTLDRFHASLPPGAPARSQMIAWVAGEGADEFAKWRDAQISDLYERLANVTAKNAYRLFVLSMRDQVPVDRLHPRAKRNATFVKVYRRSNLESLAARCRDEQITYMTSVIGETGGIMSSGAPSPKAGLSTVTAIEDVSAGIFVTPDPATDFDRTYAEVAKAYGLKLTTSRPMLMRESQSAALSLTRLIGRDDRLEVIFSGSTSLDDSALRRQSLRRFRSLPSVGMKDVEPADEAMKLAKLRQVSIDGKSYFALFNQSPWAVNANVMIATSGKLESALPSETAPTIDAGGLWRLSLEPGELVAVVTNDANASVRAWTAQVSGGAALVATVGKAVGELADSVAVVTEPKLCECIENPGFELGRPASAGVAQANATSSSGTVRTAADVIASASNVQGWLLAQHPVGCASLDDEVAYQGKYSIRLRNSEGRPGGAWIVSRQIDSPSTGRLAVSVILRGEPSEKPDTAEPILVRVAIEGTVAGTAMRQSQTFAVKRDGKWSQTPCRVEVDQMPRCGVESLRLAIDVMNEGTVWIDDVRAEDSFMKQTEKSQLQSQMFLAFGGISKGELSHAAKLLDSHWVQQMLSGAVEPPRPAILSVTETLDSAEPARNKETTEKANPGIADRLKGWLPRPIRF
jgi:hypothetical protein